MYKKLLYNIKKIKKMWGVGAIFEPETLSMYLKNNNKTKVKIKFLTEPGLEPTTSGLEKPALLSTRLNTIIGITKYECENYNFQTAIILKKSYEFLLNFYQIIFSLFSTS